VGLGTGHRRLGPPAASLSGVVGFKPTYGLISRYGLIAFASSLDTIGTFTRSVRDAAALLSTIAGKDPMDATSWISLGATTRTGLDEGVAGLRVGVVKEAFGEGVEPGVKASVQVRDRPPVRARATVSEASLPHADYALSAYYLIAPSEASSNLARYDGVRYGLRVDGADSVEMMTRTRGAGFGAEVKRRIMLGTYALSAGYYEAYYGQAQKVRTLIIRDYEAAFANVDVLISPTSPTTGVPDRRQGRRPARDVPERRVHDPGQPVGHAGDLDPFRSRRGRFAGGSTADGPGLVRAHRTAGRERAREGARVRGAAAAARARRRSPSRRRAVCRWLRKPPPSTLGRRFLQLRSRSLGIGPGAPGRYDERHRDDDEAAGEQRGGRERLVQDQRSTITAPIGVTYAYVATSEVLAFRNSQR
jgi:hypothetical protein